MYRTKPWSPFLAPRMTRDAVFVLVAAALLCIRSAAVWAGRPPSGDTSRTFALVKPATICVLTVYSATITVPAEATLAADKLEALEQRMIQRVFAGQLSPDEASLTAYALNEILDNIFAYVKPVAQRERHEKQIVSQGSGFFVTPDGYLVTNAHVVSEDEDDLKLAFVNNVLTAKVNEAVQELTNELGGNVSEKLRRKAEDAAAQWFSRYLRFESLSTQHYAMTGIAVPGKEAEQKGMPCDLVTKGEPIPGKDVAILKVSGDNFPTLPLGDDKAMKTGDSMLVVGYPGDATFHPFLAEAATVEPTLTTGVLSARKKMAGGWDAIQTDAAITHGNSGGPALDSEGRVVGLATWGAVAEKTTAMGDVVDDEIAGMNFLVPASVVKEFLDRENIKPRPSPVNALLAKAIDKMAAQHYKSAMKELRAIEALSPGATFVKEMTEEAQAAILAGKDRSWEEWLPYAVAGVVLVLLVFVGGAVAVIRAARRPVMVQQPQYVQPQAPYGALPPAYPAAQQPVSQQQTTYYYPTQPAPAPQGYPPAEQVTPQQPPAQPPATPPPGSPEQTQPPTQ